MSRNHASDRNTPGVEDGARRPPCPSALTLAHQVVIGLLRRPPHTLKDPCANNPYQAFCQGKQQGNLSLDSGKFATRWNDQINLSI